MNQSNEHLKRAQRHWYEDGLTEIAIGVGVLLYSLYFLLIPYLPHNTPEAAVVIVIAIVCFVLLAVLRAIILRVKADVSYPRTGYVKVRRAKPKAPLYKRILLTIGAFVLSLLSIYPMFYIMALRPQMAYLIFSVFISFGVIYTGFRLKLHRFTLVGSLIIGIGGVLALSDVRGVEGFTVLYAGAGILAIISGLVTFAHFLRTYKPVDMGADDGDS